MVQKIIKDSERFPLRRLAAYTKCKWRKGDEERENKWRANLKRTLSSAPDANGGQEEGAENICRAVHAYVAQLTLSHAK